MSGIGVRVAEKCRLYRFRFGKLAATWSRQTLLKMLAFELSEYLLSPLQHWCWDSRKPSDVNPVALVGTACCDLMEKNDVVLPFSH